MSRGLKTTSEECGPCKHKDQQIKELTYKWTTAVKILVWLENMILLGMDIEKLKLGIRLRRSQHVQKNIQREKTS